MEELHGGVGGGGGGVKVSLSGNNTAGLKVLISTGTMYVAGGSNITVSQNGNSLTIIGETNSDATTFLAGAGSLGNTFGTTGLVNNQLYLVGGSNVSLSQSTNAQSATLTINANAPFSAGVSTGGNTAGDTKTVSNRVVFVGGNNITLSQATAAGGATVTISGPNVAGAQTAISGISASDTLYTSGTVVFVGSNAATVKSGANQSVIIDVPVQSAQPAQTGLSGVSASDTVYTSGTFKITGSGAVTVRSGAGQAVVIDAPVHTAQTGISSVVASDATYTSGQVVFVGSNAATVKSGANQSVIVDVSIPAQTTQTYNVVSAGGNTSGVMTSFSTGTIVLMGGNNITLSQNSNSITISGPNAGGAQTGISSVSVSDTVYTSGGISFVGSGAATLKSGGGQQVIVDVPVQSAQPAQTGISGISGSDTVYSSGTVKFTGSGIVTVKSGTGQQIIIDASAAAAGVAVSGAGNTSGTMTLLSSGTVVFAGGNNITLSQDGSVITISGAEGGGAGISTFGNTAGTTGVAGAQLILVGGSNVSLSQSIDASSNNATITINAGGGAFAAGVSSGGNTAGDTKTVGSQIVFVGGSNISLSQATNGGSATITIDGASGGGAGYTAGISDLGNTAGSTGPVTGRLVLVGSNNITMSQSVDGGSATLSVIGPTGGGAGMGSTGNSAGTSGSVGKELFLFGSNNITLSQSVNGVSASLSIIGAAAGTGGGISGISASDTVYTNGTVKFVGSNAVTVGSDTGQAVVIDVTIPAQSVQTYNVVSADGNTSGTLTSFSTGTMVLAGGNNITLSQSSNTITIVGPTVFAFTGGVSSEGNTSGDTGSVINGLVFAGGNNITLSQATGVSGATITISGPNTVAQTAQTGISSVSVSDTVYTSGGISFVGSNLVTVRSDGGQAIVIDASFSQTVPPAESGNVISASGNTSGTLTSFTSGTIVLAGGNNITLSQDGSVITISGANVGGAQTGISSIVAANATYTSGQVVFVGSNNITVTSGANQSVIISGPTGGGAGMGSAGNTAGTTGTVGKELYFVGTNGVSLSQSVNGASATLTINGATGGGGGIAASLSGNVTSGGGGYSLVSSGTLYLAGGNNITLSQDGVSVTVSGANLGGAQTGISGISLSDANYTSGTVTFVGSNIVTVKSGVSGQQVVIDATVPAQSVQTWNVLSAGGNTSGTLTSYTSGTMVLAGGNNITLSQDGSVITISAANTVAQTAQTGISGLGVNGTTFTSGTVVFSDSNNVTFGTSGAGTQQTITASASFPAQSNQNIVFYATSNTISSSQGTINASSIVLRGNDALSIGISNGSLIFEAGGGDAFTGSQVIGMSNLSNTSGTSGVVSGSAIRYYLAGGNNVTLNQSLDGVSGTVTISAISVPSSSAYAANVSNVSSAGSKTAAFALADHAHVGVAGLNASGTASTFVGNVMFSGTNLTLVTGGNSSAGSLGFSVAAQSVQTQGSVQVNGSTGGISLNAGAYMSLSTVASNLTFINLLSTSGIAQPVSNVSSAGTQSSRFAMADHAHQGVAGLNVSGTASTWVGNIMLSVSNLTLVTGGNSTAGSIGISAAAPGGAGPAMGVTNTGNTAGNLFTASNGTVYIQGSNNVTASASTAAGSLSTIWISGPTGGGAGMGTGTNTSGTSGTVGKQLYLYGNSNIGLSQSVDGVSASLTLAGQAGAAGATVSEWMPPGVGYSSFTQLGQSSMVLFQVAPPYYVTASRADLFASLAVSTSSNSSHNGYISLYMGVYTRNASTLSLASSGSAAKSWNITGSTSSGSVVGWRDLSIPIDVNMTPGRYWVGVISVTNTTNANWFTASNMGLIAVPAAYSGPLGATAASNQYQLGNGVFSAQTAALPASVAFSDIVANGASTARPIVNFINLTI